MFTAYGTSFTTSSQNMKFVWDTVAMNTTNSLNFDLDDILLVNFFLAGTSGSSGSSGANGAGAPSGPTNSIQYNAGQTGWNGTNDFRIDVASSPTKVYLNNQEVASVDDATALAIALG